MSRYQESLAVLSVSGKFSSAIKRKLFHGFSCRRLQCPVHRVFPFSSFIALLALSSSWLPRSWFFFSMQVIAIVEKDISTSNKYEMKEMKKKRKKNRKMKKKRTRESVSRVRYMRLFSQCVRRRVCVCVCSRSNFGGRGTSALFCKYWSWKNSRSSPIRRHSFNRAAESNFSSRIV